MKTSSKSKQQNRTMFLMRRSCHTSCKDYLSKSIIRWKSQIVSSKFIHTDISRTIEANNEKGTRLLLHHGRRKLKTFSDKKGKEVFALHYDNPGFDLYRKIDFSPIDRMVRKCNHRFRVAGVCNWVICLADDLIDKMYSYYLCNPFIRKAVIPPHAVVNFCSHGPFDDTIGFGFDALTNDYKVVRLITLYCDDEDLIPTLAEVYSLSTNSWRSVGDIASCCKVHSGVDSIFFNGAIHWALKRWDDRRFIILTFDVGSEAFGEIMMPESIISGQLYSSKVSITADGKSLALFTISKERGRVHFVGDDDEYCLDIWVMKEYGVQKSWTRMARLNNDTGFPLPLCFWNSSEVLLQNRGLGFEEDLLVSLDLVSQQFKRVDSCDNKYCHNVTVYEESLALLDVDAAVSY